MGLALFLDSIREDLRYALRSLRRAPLFTFTAVMILALGIGVASGMFGIVHHLLLVPFNVPGHERLLMVGDRVAARGELRNFTSMARYQAYRSAQSVERLEAYAYDDAVFQKKNPMLL